MRLISLLFSIIRSLFEDTNYLIHDDEYIVSNEYKISREGKLGEESRTGIIYDSSLCTARSLKFLEILREIWFMHDSVRRLHNVCSYVGMPERLMKVPLIKTRTACANASRLERGIKLGDNTEHFSALNNPGGRLDVAEVAKRGARGVLASRCAERSAPSKPLVASLRRSVHLHLKSR